MCGAFKRTGEGDATEVGGSSQLANTSCSCVIIQSKNEHKRVGGNCGVSLFNFNLSLFNN